MKKREYEYRTRNLNPDYDVKFVPEHGLGMYSVLRETGKVCECEMKWDDAGEFLTCPVCGFDGT